MKIVALINGFNRTQTEASPPPLNWITYPGLDHNIASIDQSNSEISDFEEYNLGIYRNNSGYNNGEITHDNNNNNECYNNSYKDNDFDDNNDHHHHIPLHENVKNEACIIDGPDTQRCFMKRLSEDFECLTKEVIEDLEEFDDCSTEYENNDSILSKSGATNEKSKLKCSVTSLNELENFDEIRVEKKLSKNDFEYNQKLGNKIESCDKEFDDIITTMNRLADSIAKPSTSNSSPSEDHLSFQQTNQQTNDDSPSLKSLNSQSQTPLSNIQGPVKLTEPLPHGSLTEPLSRKHKNIPPCKISPISTTHLPPTTSIKEKPLAYEKELKQLEEATHQFDCRHLSDLKSRLYATEQTNCPADKVQWPNDKTDTLACNKKGAGSSEQSDIRNSDAVKKGLDNRSKRNDFLFGDVETKDKMEKWQELNNIKLQVSYQS